MRGSFRVQRPLAYTVAALALVPVVCPGCGSDHASVRVPPVDTTTLSTALDRLATAHLRVELSGFGPLPAGYGLTAAPVGDQDPEAPTLVRRNSVVQLNMHGVAPIPSPAFPIHHPKTVMVPDVVGLPWRKAAALLSNSGFWMQIGKVPALGPVRAEEVADRYIVREMEPTAGTELVWGGRRIP